MGKRVLPAIVLLMLATPDPAASQEAGRIGLRLLVAPTEAEAVELRGRLEAGAVFERLARTHSLDPSRTSGGYLGTFRMADLRQEFRDALQNVAPGELSPVSRIGDRYFLFQRLTEAEADWIAAEQAGIRALELGRYAEAGKFFEAAAEQAEVFGPGDYRPGETLDNLAAALTLQTNYAEALPLFERALAIRWSQPAVDPPPDVASVLEDFAALLSLAYFRDIEFDRILSRYQAAIEQMPLNEDLYTAMAGMFQAAELTEEAEIVLLRAVEAFPDSVLTQYALGELYALSGKHFEALELFKGAAAISRNAAGTTTIDQLQRGFVLGRMGDTHVELGQLDDALRAYQDALELDSTNLETHLSLGDLYVRRAESRNLSRNSNAPVPWPLPMRGSFRAWRRFI